MQACPPWRRAPGTRRGGCPAVAGRGALGCMGRVGWAALLASGQARRAVPRARARQQGGTRSGRLRLDGRGDGGEARKCKGAALPAAARATEGRPRWRACGKVFDRARGRRRADAGPLKGRRGAPAAGAPVGTDGISSGRRCAAGGSRHLAGLQPRSHIWVGRPRPRGEGASAKKVGARVGTAGAADQLAGRRLGWASAMAETRGYIRNGVGGREAWRARGRGAVAGVARSGGVCVAGARATRRAEGEGLGLDTGGGGGVGEFLVGSFFGVIRRLVIIVPRSGRDRSRSKEAQGWVNDGAPGAGRDRPRLGGHSHRPVWRSVVPRGKKRLFAA
jgi:hypothetical protein